MAPLFWLFRVVTSNQRMSHLRTNSLYLRVYLQVTGSHRDQKRSRHFRILSPLRIPFRHSGFRATG
jgi:hypothetical protein